LVPGVDIGLNNIAVRETGLNEPHRPIAEQWPVADAVG
jgi:hypothetical protein